MWRLLRKRFNFLLEKRDSQWYLLARRDTLTFSLPSILNANEWVTNYDNVHHVQKLAPAWQELSYFYHLHSCCFCSCVWLHFVKPIAGLQIWHAWNIWCYIFPVWICRFHTLHIFLTWILRRGSGLLGTFKRSLSKRPLGLQMGQFNEQHSNRAFYCDGSSCSHGRACGGESRVYQENQEILFGWSRVL